jgi:transcriptional regulator with PAS, ATPase and Fis domain
MLLDEIGEMPVIMQVKLLRVLQEKKLIRVGGTQQIPVDVRILAATNRDLKKEVKRGNFRQDLYYRLNVVSVEIPPLRKRRDDIPLLIEHFLAKYLPLDRRIKSISPEALDVLMAYEYPGNVRELENIIERSLAMCREDVIRPHHLPPDLDRHQKMHLPVDGEMFIARTLAEHERIYILSLLTKLNGNKTKTASVLGIDRVSLWRKLKKYEKDGIDEDDFTPTF